MRTNEMKANKVWSILAVLFLCIGMLTGCGGNQDADSTEININGTEVNLIKRGDSDPAKKSIVCTTFPQYDWMRNVLGQREDEFNLSLLLDNGMDLHSYQPTAEDMSKIAACDLFVYVGGASDAWVEDALKEATNSNMQVVNLMEVSGSFVKEEEVVEGMQEDAHEHEEKEYDEHVWLSLKNAQRFTTELASAMGVVDKENAQEYMANAEEYNQKLAALDGEYMSLMGEEKNDTVLFGDRFPLRYLVDDYGWNYFAAFAGCSAETEASFETIAFLAGKVDELKLQYIFVLEGSDQKIAEAIINSTKDKSCEIITVNSMQAVTGRDVEEGITYLSVMEDNLAAFEKALR